MATAEISHKPFPWKCGNCGKRAVAPSQFPYSVDMEHDGRTYTVSVADLEAPRCNDCGELILDDAANQQISAAFRKQLGLLTPDEIRSNRDALRMTQRQLAGRLGIAEATLSRWETGGQIQQRALDRLLRLFFGSAEVRAALADEKPIELGKTVPPAKAQADSVTDRADPISRLAAVLRELPQEMEEAAVQQFHQLAVLMSASRKQPVGN